MNHSGSGKRQAKVLEEHYWDCSVCTYRNTAEAFKCLMCDVRKDDHATSLIKSPEAWPSRGKKNSLVIERQRNGRQVTQQQYVPQLKSGKKELAGGVSGGSSSSGGGIIGTKHKLDKPRRRSRHPPRLKNIDRSSATTNEVTVNNVTVVITEYKPKMRKTTTSAATSSDQSGLSSSASSENGSQHDSNQDSRSLDISTDA